MIFYQTNLRINEELRKMLTEAIINIRSSIKYVLSPKIINYISNGIINLFQYEDSLYNLKFFI